MASEPTIRKRPGSIYLDAYHEGHGKGLTTNAPRLPHLGTAALPGVSSGEPRPSVARPADHR